MTLSPRNLARALTVILSGIIILLLLMQTSPKLPITVAYADKWAHVMLFGGLTILAGIAWNNISKAKLWLIIVLFGSVMELTQGVLTMRTASFSDYVANLLGVSISIMLLILVPLTYHKIRGNSSKALDEKFD